jgi:hypothetical protein
VDVTRREVRKRVVFEVDDDLLDDDLLRWTQPIGLPDTTVRAARTLRRRLF